MGRAPSVQPIKTNVVFQSKLLCWYIEPSPFLAFFSKQNSEHRHNSHHVFRCYVPVRTPHFFFQPLFCMFLSGCLFVVLFLISLPWVMFFTQLSLLSLSFVFWVSVFASLLCCLHLHSDFSANQGSVFVSDCCT